MIARKQGKISIFFSNLDWKDKIKLIATCCTIASFFFIVFFNLGLIPKFVNDDRNNAKYYDVIYIDDPSAGDYILPTTLTIPEIKLTIGDTGRTADCEITAYSAQKYNSYQEFDSQPPHPVEGFPSLGNTLVIIDVDIKNIGSDPTRADAGHFSIGDSEGNPYRIVDIPYHESLYSTTLLQNQHKRGIVGFQVPSSAKGLILYYIGSCCNYDSPAQCISWKIPD